MTVPQSLRVRRHRSAVATNGRYGAAAAAAAASSPSTKPCSLTATGSRHRTASGNARSLGLCERFRPRRGVVVRRSGESRASLR